MIRYIFSLCFVAILFSCNELKKEQLLGKWKAVQLTEEGDSLKVNLAEIKLEFNQNSYEFASTLNYREAGSYDLKENLLITRDSLNKRNPEKIVEISKLQNDSLFIRMNEAGKERILVMTKN